MDVSERLLTTINRRNMVFICHIQRRNYITSDLLLGMVYGKRREEDESLDVVATSKRFLMEEV